MEREAVSHLCLLPDTLANWQAPGGGTVKEIRTDAWGP